MSKRRTLLIGVVVSLLIVVALLGGGLLTIAGTGSQYFDYDQGWHARGFFYVNTEVFDSVRYVSSMDSAGLSEKILVNYQTCGPDGYPINGWAIKNAPSGPYSGKAFLARFILNGEVELEPTWPAEQFDVDGNIRPVDCWALTVPFVTKLQGQKVGDLKVEMWQYMDDTLGFGTDGWYKYAEDSSQIVSGRGDCVLVNGDVRPFKPGEEVIASCDIGYAYSGKETPEGGGGWRLDGDWAQGIAFLGNGPGLNVRATFAAPSSTGIHEIRLSNGLFDIAKRVFTISVNPEQAPPPPTVSFSPNGPWLTGQTIVMSWKAVPNFDTNVAIKQVHYEVFYVNGDSIAKGSGSAQSSITFNTGGKDLDIRVAVVAEDANGEFSAPTQPTIEVQGCDLYTQCRGGPPGGGFVIPLWVFLFLGAVVVGLLAMFVPVPFWPWKVILLAIAGILVFIGVVLILW